MLKCKISRMYLVEIIDENGIVVEIPGDYCEPADVASIEVYGDRKKAEKEGKELLEYTRAKIGRK